MNRIVPVCRNRFAWKQWLAALTASIPMLGIHFHVMWGTDIEFFETGPWFLVKPILLIIGVIIGAFIADIFGRRLSLIITSILLSPGLPACFLFTDLYFPKICSIGCFLLGTGVRSVLVFLYISEISSSNNRRNLMVLQLPVHCFWLFTACCTSRLLHTYFYIGLIILFVNSMILHVVIICVYPETPGYLKWKKRYDEATKALDFFGVIDRRSPSSQDELNPTVNLGSNLNEGGKWGERIREMLKPCNLKNLGIIFFLITIRRASGQDQFLIVLYDTLIAMHNFDHILSSDSIAVVFLCGVTFIISILVMLKIDVFAEKVYLLWFMFVNFIAAVIGAFVTGYFWAMVSIIYVQYICHTIFIAVTFAYVGEFFPINVRAIAIAAVLSYEILMRSLYSLIFFEPKITMNYPYSIPAQRYFGCGVMLAAFFFALKFLPQTNSRSVVPRSDITCENFAEEEYLPIEEIPHTSKIIKVKFTASDVMCYA